MNQPLVSVIIPVYKTEEFLPRCIKSVVGQTYSNLEIIIVDDCSPGNAQEIVQEFMHVDPRIKFIRHEKNKGLYHARLTGSEMATGDFIAFVDSDDYISIDYYRLLVEKALREDADIVEGRFVRENESGYQFIQNFNNLLVDVLVGEQLRESFFSQEGLFYHWHVIWNKIYKKNLWDQCMPYFRKQDQHLIMTEDLVFSSILFCNAEKYCSIPYGTYYYCVRSDAATGSKINLGSFLKNFRDMGVAFDFVDSYLRFSGLYELYGHHLFNWKKRYFRVWTNRIQSLHISYKEKKQLLDEIKRAFQIEEIEPIMPEDTYFAQVNTAWDNRYEILKAMIADQKHEYISFDIFDTLVVRPFLEPKDLYHFLDEYYHHLDQSGSLVSFSSLRIQAENHARSLVRFTNPFWQDVNLDEIYDQIGKDYDLDKDLLNKLKSREIELEIEFAQRRESIYELYKMARFLNKKIIFVSDMYLPSSVIKQILNKCGYDYYDRLYVSSETRALKNTGDMFSYVINDLKTEPGNILHIGDNWESDKVMAEKAGLNSFFIPKTADLLLNRLTDKESGNSIKSLIEHEMRNWSESEFLEYFGIRCMLGVVANKLFDYPFPAFHGETDFNADPYMVGYYALGMHVFGLCKWIIEDASAQGIDSIHFIARDGYLPYQVYNIIASSFSGSPKANYIYASRKSLLPYYLLPPNQYDLESVVVFRAHTPMSLIKLFEKLLRDDWELQHFESRGIHLLKPFSSTQELKAFTDLLIHEAVDHIKLQRAINNIKKYLNQNIKPNDALFDLGYSARLQTIISNILGFKLGLYFVHTNKELPWMLSRRNGFRLKSFYDFKPGISGVLREHLFAEIGPSCLSYEEDASFAYPVFEEYRSNPINELMIGMMHKGCIDFAQDMQQKFGQYFSIIKFRNKDVSLPLEMFIHNARPIDRIILQHAYWEDDVYGGENKGSLLTWWESQKRQHFGNTHQESVAELKFLDNHGKIAKIIFYAIFDRDTLKQKVKFRLKERPLLLHFLAGTYRTLRFIKRGVMRMV